MEILINRIRRMMWYTGKEDIIEQLQKEGVDNDTIFLAYCAAKRLNEVN